MSPNFSAPQISIELISTLHQLKIPSLAELCTHTAEFLARRFNEYQLNTLNNALLNYLWQAGLKLKDLNQYSLPLEILGLAPYLQQALINDSIYTITDFIYRDATHHLSARWPRRDRLAVQTRILCLLTLSPDQIEELKQLFESSKFQKIDVLGLSIRAHNCLMRAGIETVERLAAMSDEDLAAIRNLGSNSLAEIREKLTVYLFNHPLPMPPQPSESFLRKPEQTQAQKLSSPESFNFQKIEILGLSTRTYNCLKRAGIDAVESLAAMSDDAILSIKNLGPNSLAEIQKVLAAYRLNPPLPTPSQSPESTLRSTLVEPTVVTPKSRSLEDEHSEELALSEVILAWLAVLSERQLQIISLRYGLNKDEPLTLEQAGQLLGVTRERVRQIEAQGLKKLKKYLKYYLLRPLNTFVTHLFEKAGGVLNKAQLMEMLEGITVAGINPVGLMELVLELREDITWLKQAQVWIRGSDIADEVINVQAGLFEIVEQNLAPVPISKLLNLFKQGEYYQSREGTLSDEFILACLRSHIALVEDEQGNVGLEKWTRRRLDDIILALRKIGEPAHYTLIAKGTNALLPPDQQTTPHNIHAQMQRLPEIFVRVGHGIYGLKEWGLYDDGSVANAAYRVLREAGRPLHIDSITEQVLKTWNVRSGSIQAALENDTRFSRIGAGIYCLQEQVGSGLGMLSPADFGDLFGTKLARWQEELDRQQASSKFDIQAEVDKIRKLGTDFLT